MSDSPVNELQHDVEATLRRYGATHLVRLFPIIESLDIAILLVQTLAERTTPLVLAQIPEETKRGRSPDEALFRAERWLWRLCWDDLISHPSDTLCQRFERLESLLNQTAKLPPHRGKGKYDSRLVFLNYLSLHALFHSRLKRRPGPSRRKVPAVTCGPGSGKERQRLLKAETDKKVAEWQSARTKEASGVLPVRWWQEGREFWFDDADFFDLTPEIAAYTVLARDTGRSIEAVKKQVKDGRKLLPQKTIDDIEEAYKAHRHAPEVCKALGCPQFAQ